MFSGLTAGAIAAIIAALVSLPLRSPSDTLFNSLSVSLAGLLAGVLAGLLWLALRNSPARAIRFLAIWSALYLPAAAAVILYGRTQLDHFTAFALPLALLIYLATGALTVALHRYLPNLRWWYAGVAVAAALTIGFGLVGRTDQESGELQLPPPSSRVVPVDSLPPARAGELRPFAFYVGEGAAGDKDVGSIRIQQKRGL